MGRRDEQKLQQRHTNEKDMHYVDHQEIQNSNVILPHSNEIIRHLNECNQCLRIGENGPSLTIGGNVD